MLERGLLEEAVVISGDLKILDVNKAFLRANSLSRDIITGKNCYDILKGCQESCRESKRECPLHEIATTREPVSITLCDIEVNGHHRHFKIDIYPIVPGHNEPVSFLHITRDISNRIEEERFKEGMWTEILGRMELIYSSMVKNSTVIDRVNSELDFLDETIPLAMVKWDARGNIVKWNSSAEVLFGWHADEISGEPFMKIFASGESQERFQQELGSIIKGKSLAYAISENRTASGKIIACEWYHCALNEEGVGKVSGGLSMGQDVTERNRVQKELTDTREKLTAFLQSTDEAIFGINHFSRIINWNQAAESLFGWLKHEVIGRQIDQFDPAGLLGRFRAKIDAYFSQVSTKPFYQIFETTAKHRDGSGVPVLVKLSSAKLDDKPVIIGVIHDISVRKRMEKILAETEKIRELGELAAGAAHDFNNILSIIQGNAQLLKQGGQERKYSDKLEIIEQAVADARRKTGEILRFAGAETAEEARSQVTMADLNELAGKAIDLTRFRWHDQAQKEGHTIEVSTEFCDAPLLPMEVDCVRDVLVNVLYNAIDAVAGSGKIHVRTSREETDLRLTVEDNGHGVTQEEVNSFFKPFYTTKKTGHSGLGLSTAKNIIARHGGKMYAESSFGVGTTIIIELPLSVTVSGTEDKESVTVTRTAPPVVSDQISDNPPKHLRILVVEDNPMVGRVLKESLTNAGHTVTLASDGKAGIAQIRVNDFDLIITDLGMPEMGGDEFVKRLKVSRPEMPVLVLTGWREDLDVNRLLSSGVAQVISKPFDLDELMSHVNAYAAKLNT